MKNATSPRPISANQIVSTPRELLDAIEARFGHIAYDLAANADNAVCRDFIGDPRKDSIGSTFAYCSGSINAAEKNSAAHRNCIALDGLLSVWPTNGMHGFAETGRLPVLPGWSWCNPPFKDGAAWAQRHHYWYVQSQLEGYTRRTMLLLPASVDSDWYREHVEPIAIRLFLSPRITFPPERNPYPKPMMLALYDPELRECVHGEDRARQWRWREFLQQHRAAS